MKKLFSILAVLVMVLAFYPTKVEAKVSNAYPVVTGNEADDGFCEAGGETCCYEELGPVYL